MGPTACTKYHLSLDFGGSPDRMIFQPYCVFAAPEKGLYENSRSGLVRRWSEKEKCL